jgi:Flp pilus assembly pilin Flp
MERFSALTILFVSNQRRPHFSAVSNQRRAAMKKQIRKNRRGQGMTEYIIIVALIAIAAIGVITLFGDNIRKLFGMSADALAGNDNVSMRAQSSNNTLEQKKMANFAQNNAY